MKDFYVPPANIIYFGNGKKRFQHSPIYVDYPDDRRISGHHWHDYTQIWYTVSGSYEHTINGETRIQRAGDVAIVFPYSIHQINTLNSDLDATNVIDVSIDTSALEKILPLFCPISYNLALYGDRKLNNFSTFHGKDKERADEIFCGLLSSLLNCTAVSPEKTLLKLNDFFEMCSRPLDGISNRRIKTLKSHAEDVRFSETYARENIQSSLSVNDICIMANMSPRLFISSFKEITNQTYHSYLLNLRLKSALNDLMYTDRTLYEIAHTHCFAHSSHFIHICNRYTGMSPTEFRNKAKKINSDQIHITDRRESKLSALAKSIGELFTAEQPSQHAVNQ